MEGIAGCKTLKIRLFEKRAHRILWQFRCSYCLVANARLRFLRFGFPLGCLTAAERSDRSRDRAGLADWTTDAAVRPTESETSPQPCIVKGGIQR